MKQGNHFGLLAAQLIKKKNQENFKRFYGSYFLFFVILFLHNLKLKKLADRENVSLKKNRDNFGKGLKFLMNDTAIEILVTKETYIKQYHAHYRIN